MAQISVHIPDFAEMEDEDVRRHPLARFRDGRWSSLSQHLRDQFKTDRLNLNEAWAMTSPAWQCPACQRQKVEIARKTGNGVVLCQLERHHDHLRDLAEKILRENACADVPDTLISQRRRACVAVLPLVERFAETLVCMDCNAVDAAMKVDLGNCVHGAFSFSPSEIGGFVFARPNAPHDWDLDCGREIWAKADADFHERLRFVEQMAERLCHGLHDREQYSEAYNIRGDEDARMFLSLARHQLGARGDLPHLGEALRSRSCAIDGHRSAQAKVPPSRVRIPSSQEFAAHDKAMQKLGPWSKAGSDWRCACCLRSKRDIMRISSKGKWTGHIHEINDYVVETEERALAFRSFYRADSPIFKSANPVTICQDCRLVLTDAGKLRTSGGGSENCLSPELISNLVGTGAPNCRHIVSDDQMRAAIERNQRWADAAADYWKHREHVTEASLRMAKFTDGHGMPRATARQHAMAELTASESLPSWNAAECFDWLMEEWNRLKR